MKLFIRRILPLVLIVAGVSALSGCLFIAEKERVVSGPDVPALVGESSEKKTVTPGVQKARVIELLGWPDGGSRASNELIYRFSVRNGRWLGGTIGKLMNADPGNYQKKQVRLRFNPDGSLQTYRIEEQDDFLDTAGATQPSN